MRKYTIPQNMTVEYFLTDHLGSTSLTTDSAGNKVSELRYKPWGETRYTWADPSLDTTPAYAMTRYQYTGQFSYAAEFGLYFYNARWYDSQLGRFAQADTLVPEQTQGTQAWDRYAGMNNNPVRYNDPSGHIVGILGVLAYGALIYGGLALWGLVIAPALSAKASPTPTPTPTSTPQPTATLNPTVSSMLTATPTGTPPTPQTVLKAGPIATAMPNCTLPPVRTQKPDKSPRNQGSYSAMDLFDDIAGPGLPSDPSPLNELGNVVTGPGTG